MDAIRGLSKTSKGLSEIYTQLASGSRINKASDDAAGLAIASKLNADSRVYGQGIKNINDGISVLQIASNAITSLKDITIRRQELAEQSANGVYSDKQRESLNKEFLFVELITILHILLLKQTLEDCVQIGTTV